MKTSYIVRAKKFIRQILPYIIPNITWIPAVEKGVNEFCIAHNRKIKVAYGSARIALITSDYVIKWNYDNEAVEDIGGNTEELKMYEKAKEDGFDYLLAEPTKVTINGYDFIIMPKVNIGRTDNKGKQKRAIQNYLTDEEYMWTLDNIDDLHIYNWGFLKNKPVITDYALNTMSLNPQ